jgi:hypothetical protein
MRALGLTSCIACIIIGLAAAHAQTLAERFARLSCAIVHISAGYELGTGFFIDSTGTLVTAAHVISRRYCTNNNNPCGLNVLPTYPITVVFSDGHSQLSDITIPITTGKPLNTTFYVFLLDSNHHVLYL